MRALALFCLALALLTLGFALAFPDRFQLMTQSEIASVVWLLAAALFLGVAAFGVGGRGGASVSWRRRLLYLAIWAATIITLVAVYQLATTIASGGRVST